MSAKRRVVGLTFSAWADASRRITYVRACAPLWTAEAEVVEVAGQRHAVRLARSAGAAGNVCRERDALAVSAWGRINLATSGDQGEIL